jgi:hypothetical protein
MSNIHIAIEHQAAPTLKYDAVLARENALIRDPNDRRDWDAFDWEMHAPGHDDPNIALLRRDTKSDPWSEENCELFEMNCARSAWMRWQGQERWQGRKNEEERLVNILHPLAVMRKLRNAGVDARGEEHPNATIWLNEQIGLGRIGVNAWVNPVETDEEGYLEELRQARDEGFGQHKIDRITENYYACRDRRKIKRTLTTLQYPYGPEFSIMRFDKHNVPTKEKYRGWRTAMLVLIYAGILTEAQVDAAFGPPIGAASEFYRQQLYTLRQVRANGGVS